MNISGGQGLGSCGGRGGGRAGAEPCPSAWRCSECVRSQPMRAGGGREKGLGGLQARGLQMDAWQSGSHARPRHHPVCPSYFHRLLTEARCQQPPRSPPLSPPRAPPAPCIAPPFFFFGGGQGTGDWWHYKGLPPPQGPQIPPALPLPRAVPAPVRHPPRGLRGLRQDFSFLSSSRRTINNLSHNKRGNG